VKSKTVVISLVVHLGLAFALFGATNRRVMARRQATAVRLADEKKKPPAPKPTPKAVVKPPPRKVATAPIPKEEQAPARAAPVAHTTAVATAIKMTSDDAVGAGDVVVPVSGRALATVGPPPSRKPRLGEGDDGPCHEEPSKPEPVFKTEIEYTARAKADGIEGKLKLKLVVGRDGSVVDVEVLAGVSPELDAAAVEAAKKWRFRPAMACGKPVAGGSYVLARKFELGD
jgi:protein TonB